jgi:nucleolar GTP-binding protein
MKRKGLPQIYSPDKLVEIAFARAAKEAKKKRIKNPHLRKKRGEEKRIRESTSYIVNYLSKIEKIDGIVAGYPIFYQDLLNTNKGFEKLRKALEKIHHTKVSIEKLAKRTRRNLRTSKGEAVALRREFYGRTATQLKKIKPELITVGDFTEAVKHLPTIKEEFSVVIAGMPNVGKSSLLKKITASTPRVETYPFTTKNILVGYIRKEHKTIQVIDTPGLLDRPLDARNPIEKQAILALKHLAGVILFILDPTEICGFTISSQIGLYREISSNFEDVVAVINKIDIAEQASMELISKEIPGKQLKCSAKEGEVDEILTFIFNSLKRARNLVLL